MAEMITIPKDDLTRLEARVRNLDLEKSSLQLVNDLMSRLSAVPGLENTVAAIVRLILSNIGGSNVAIYYLVGAELRYADVFGRSTTVTAVDDPLARQALETRTLVTEVRDFTATRMTTPEFTKASYWALPLLVADQLIGVLKMDGMPLAAAELSAHLQPFFNYAALVLKNEIEGHLKLTEATQLAAIVESSDDAIIGKTLDGIITSWNRGAERVYGYSEAEMVGRPMALLVPPGREDEIPGILARLQAGEPIEHYETQRRRKDGQVIHMSLTLSPIRDATGRIVAAASIGRDITGRTRAEEALRQSAEEIRDLYNHAPCGYHSLDAAGTFVRINDTELSWLGYAREEIVGRMEFLDLLTPPSREIFRREFPGFKERGFVSDLDFEVVRKDGTSFPILLSATVLRDAAGNFLMSRSVVHDMTERRRAEDSLRESQALYHSLVEQLPAGVFRKDAAGRYVYANPWFCRLKGVKAEVFLGRTPDEVKVIELAANGPNVAQVNQLAAQAVDHHRQILATGQPIEIEEHGYGPDGREQHLSVLKTPIFDLEGKIVGSQGILFDVTDRKQAEAALRRLNRELRAISNCNEVLMRATDETTLLNDVCRIVCDQAGYRMAWVGYAENDAAQTVRSVAWAGVEDGYIANAQLAWGDTERGCGPTGRAIRSGQSAWIQDFETDPGAALWREAALQRGYRSSIALPLKDDTGAVFGAFMIYSTAPGTFTPEETRLLEELAGDLAFGITVLRGRVERQRAEAAHRADLWFFESMDQINRAMQGADDLEQMLSDVLDTMLSVFGCDRAFLAVPCDPTLPEFQISMERTVPRYPGAFARGVTVPMSPAVRNLFQELLSNPVPNEIHVGKGLELEDAVWKTYEIKSQLAIALHPKIGKPWECGLHQCSYNRVWTPQEKKLFLEISRRLGDALTSLLTYRDLRESEQRFRLVFENSPVSIWEEDFSRAKKLLDDLRTQGITDIEAHFAQHPELVRQCAELTKIIDVNRAALALHGATSKEELRADLTRTFTPESFDTFRRELVCLWNGGAEMSTDAIVKTLQGDPRCVRVYFAVCPGYEESFGKVLVSLVDITERKRAEQERQTHLRFLEAMDRINRAIQANNDLEHMMSTVLDVVLSVFDCDRAFLLHPCDPQASVWSVPMERTKPEHPGVLALGVDMPMSPPVADTLRTLLAADGVVRFGPGTPHPLPADTAERFGFKSLLSMALHPRTGQPWQFGIHQCARARTWTAEEERLFQEVGRRLADALTTLLAHRDLRESEQRFYLVFENSPVSIWEEDFSGVKSLLDSLKAQGVSDIESYFAQHPETVRRCAGLAKIIDVNRAALALHGAATKDELLAGLVNTFTPESFDAFRQELVCLWNGGTELSQDTVVKTLGGELRHVTVYFSVCPGHETTLARVLVSLADITERKRVEEALVFVAQRGWQTGAENFFAALAQFLGEKLDMDYALIDRIGENPELAETVALYAKGALAPNLRYALKGTPCENVMGRRLCVYREGIQQLFPEDPLLPQMGAESYIGIPLWDSAGQPIGLIAVMSRKPLPDAAPVTQLLQLVATRAAAELERERSDRWLRTREHEFRTLAENLPDNIVRYNREGRTIYVNPALEKTLGANAARMLGTTIRELHPDGSYETYAQAVDAALTRGANGEIEITVPVPGREPLIHQIRTIVERDAPGQVSGVLAIGRDITERKRAEAELRQLNQELDQRVKDRTAELEVKNKELERMNRLFVGRELRMVELKQRIRDLEQQGRGSEPAGET